jgi:hypothetical protein
MRLEFSRSNHGIGIPYQPVDRPGGHSNYGYVDLKRNPEKIDDISELQDVPALKALVKELNHERSIVRSLSVEKALGPNADPAFQPKLTSFVRICFEILPWNFHVDNYRKLFDTFKDGVRRMPNLPDLLTMEFEVDPASFRDHNNVSGWAMTIWTHGFGRTDKEATDHWTIGLSTLQDFFAFQRSSFQSELDKGEVTVS